MKQIRKRDNKLVDFDQKKIEAAILAAMTEVDQVDNAMAKTIADTIASGKYNSQNEDGIFTVEEIQDLVESELLHNHLFDVAKAYIKYRAERTRIRNLKSDLFKQIKEKVHCDNNECSNANVDEEGFGARKNEAAGVMMKELAIIEMIDPKVREKWENNELYIHDMTQYVIGDHNCLNADIQHLLLDGFYTRNGGVRGAKSISTAMQLVAVIFQAQSQGMFGGVGSAHIDYDLAPFVRMSFIKHYKDGVKYLHNQDNETYEDFFHYYGEDNINTASISAPTNIFNDFCQKAYEYALDMLDKEGTQAAQALFHNLNTLESRPKQ